MTRRRLLALSLLCIGAACQPESTTPVAETTVLPDSADQVLFGVRFFMTDAGVRKAELVADTAYMYEDNTRTEMRVVNTTFFKASGEKDATLTAKQGTYNVRLGSMEARGDVVVISTDGRKLETPQLRYDPARNEISGDSAFVMTDPSRRISGIGFISDPDMNNVKVLRAAKSSGNQLTIPKS
jgi:LPS export ABC transporter protein LptC